MFASSSRTSELRKPAYVGHSWGGNIGTILASDSPDLISRAFLEDPVYLAHAPRFHDRAAGRAGAAN